MNRLLQQLSDIETLAAHRDLNTPERHSANDFYGHAEVLKKFAGWPRKTAIKGVIEHSFAMNPDYIWDQDIKAGLPGLIVFCEERRRFMQAATDLRVEAVGPIIDYAVPVAPAEEADALHGELGRVLLAFPVHSIHEVNAEYNVISFREELLRRGRDYDNVLVCLGWKDVQRGLGDIYGVPGITCITAGHMFDPLFLPRLKTIISLADMTVSTNFSTHVGYCIHLGKPHAVIDTEIVFVSPTASLHARDAACMEEVNREKTTSKYHWMIEPFLKYSTTVTPAQAEVISRCFGQDDLKTPEELHAILDGFERIHAREACMAAGATPASPAPAKACAQRS